MAATTSPSPDQSSLVDGPMYHLCCARHCASIALVRDAFNCCFLTRALTCSPFTRRSLPCGPPASGAHHLAPHRPHRPQTCWALPRQQHRPSYPPMHYFCWPTVMATRDDTPRSQVVSERLGLCPTVQLNQPKVVHGRASMHATIRVQQLVMVRVCLSLSW